MSRPFKVAAHGKGIRAFSSIRSARLYALTDPHSVAWYAGEGRHIPLDLGPDVSAFAMELQRRTVEEGARDHSLRAILAGATF